MSSPYPRTRDHAAALKHFQSIPWINQDWLKNPQYIPLAWATRSDLGVDGFFGRTLDLPSAIPHLFVVVNKDLQTPQITEDLATSAAQPSQPVDLALLIELGPDGLDSYPGVSHGGVNAALLDHIMGYTVTAHWMRLVGPDRPLATMGVYTAHVNVRFFRMVKTGGRQVVVRCWLVGRTREKWALTAQIVDEKGRVLVQGDSVWIVAKGKL